jgi:ribosomal protein S19E (S16A)
METVAEIKLSPSEKWTLQKVAEGELHVSEMDWLALQHLKKHGLSEDRPAGVGITKEGRRVLRRLMAGSASV